MGFFWKWLSVALTTTLLTYAAIIALSTLVLPWAPIRFDTDVSTTNQPFWDNETRYLMANKRAFEKTTDRVIILGASNTREAFRPELVEPHLPGWQINMAGFGGANISEVSDAVDLIYDEMGEGPRGRSIFVIGTYYLSFVSSEKLWPNGNNPVATEAARAGLYAREGLHLTPQYPRPLERIIAAMLRPQAVISHLPRAMGDLALDNPNLPQLKAFADSTLRARDPLSRWTEFLGEHPDLNQVLVPGEMKRALLEQRLKAAGGDHALPTEQFDVLERLIDRIRKRGDSVVIVNVPLPRWHIDGVPLAETSYQTGLAAAVARHVNDPKFGYMSLLDTNADENFFDSAHTKPRQWPVWSQRLADYISVSVAKPQSR